MNIREPHKNLIPVKDFARTYLNRRGLPSTPQAIYNAIYRAEQSGKKPPFNYVVKGNQIWIKK